MAALVVNAHVVKRSPPSSIPTLSKSKKKDAKQVAELDDDIPSDDDEVRVDDHQMDDSGSGIDDDSPLSTPRIKGALAKPSTSSFSVATKKPSTTSTNVTSPLSSRSSRIVDPEWKATAEVALLMDQVDIDDITDIHTHTS
jgi:hypothetical protein